MKNVIQKHNSKTMEDPNQLTTKLAVVDKNHVVL